MTNQEQDRLSEVLQKINELARKAAGGDYLYRGEPKDYPQVSSKLYRDYAKISAESFDIAAVQKEILKETNRFIYQTDEFEVLTQLQHFGCATNLIDFTTDYNIALFFACYSKPEEDGRVIILKKSEHQSLLKEPKNPMNRVVAQKSVFVESPKGFVEPSETVVIPRHLKIAAMKYLDESHGVNAATVFNDIHGFIRYYTVHQNAYEEAYVGLTYGLGEDDEKAIEHYSKAIELNPQLAGAYYNRGVAYARMDDDNRAIQDYNRAIELNAGFTDAYINRGAMYWHQGNHSRAIEDFNKAIELDSSETLAYFNRGLSMLSTEEWGKAALDLSHAESLGLDIVSTFHNEFRSVAEFEQNYSIQLPGSIKDMLTPSP